MFGFVQTDLRNNIAVRPRRACRPLLTPTAHGSQGLRARYDAVQDASSTLEKLVLQDVAEAAPGERPYATACLTRLVR